MPLQALENLSNKFQSPVGNHFLPLTQRILTSYEATTRVEFPNLIIPNTALSSSVATPTLSKAVTNSINQIKEQPEAVSGSSKSGAAVEVAAKEAPLKGAATKGRARGENGGDEEDGDTSPVKRLRLAKAPKAQNPRKIINHAPIHKLDVFVCGQGSSGELGLGNGKIATDVKHPRLNHKLLPNKVGVVHIAVGGKHAAALTHDGLVYTWGSNEHGALGRDTRWQRSANNDIEIDDDDTFDLNTLEGTPMPIPSENFPLDIVLTKLACGDSTTFALTDDGDVWGWGTFRVGFTSLTCVSETKLIISQSIDGILGFSKDVKIQSTPTKLPNLSNVKQLVCGANHAIALREDGKVFIWGSGEQNQLGHRVPERKRYDSLIPAPLRLNKKYRLIGCGIDHSFAVEINKEDVWAWGLNSFGETGSTSREADGSYKAAVISPVRVPTLSLSEDTISTITGGSHHSAATTTNGKLLVWGRLDGHRLGIDPTSLPDADIIKDSSDRPRFLARPTEILTPAIGTARFVAVGYDHNIALNTAGQAYSWGLNVNHQCGHGVVSTDIDEPICIDTPAVRNRELTWAGCGGEFSVMAAVAKGDGGAE